MMTGNGCPSKLSQRATIEPAKSVQLYHATELGNGLVDCIIFCLSLVHIGGMYICRHDLLLIVHAQFLESHAHIS